MEVLTSAIYIRRCPLTDKSFKNITARSGTDETNQITRTALKKNKPNAVREARPGGRNGSEYQV